MLLCECSCVCCHTQSFLVSDEGKVMEGMRCPGCTRPYYAKSTRPFGEAEWNACEQPEVLVSWRGERTTLRKLQLFACACSRMLLSALIDPHYRSAIETAERYADGLTSDAELSQAFAAAVAAAGAAAPAERWTAPVVAGFSEMQQRGVLRQLARALKIPAESARQVCRLFRDVMGNPFAPLARLPEAALQANDAAARKLARGIYDERAFERMPILGDALEDAGCSDEQVLAHCRGPGPHARGCWVVDQILGKK